MWKLHYPGSPKWQIGSSDVPECGLIAFLLRLSKSRRRERVSEKAGGLSHTDSLSFQPVFISGLLVH